MADAGLLEVVEAIDALDFEPLCQPSTATCDQPARWLGFNSCCEHVELYCDAHKRGLERLFEVFEPRTIQHVRCHRKGGTVRWEPLRGPDFSSGGGHA